MEEEEQAVLVPVAARPISLVPVGLKEAALDSPSFRATTVHFNDQVDAVEKWLEGFMKAISKLSHEVAWFETLITTFLGSTLPPQPLSEAILDHDYALLAAQRYGDIAKDFWNTAIAGLKKLDQNLVEPIRAFLQGDLRNFKELRRQILESQRQVDQLQWRYSSQAKTKESSSLREDAFQLHEARKAYLRVSMDYAVAAPNLRIALDKLIVKVFYDQAQTTWKTQGNQNLSKWTLDLERVKGWSREMEAGEKAFRREIHVARKHIEESAETRARPSRELEDYTQFSVPAMLSKGPTSGQPSSKPKSAEKQGWLNLRTLNVKPTRHIWVRRWFYVKNGIFGWLVQGTKSGGVEESERIGVLLCGVRPAGLEERRFCFEVKTKDTSIMVQADSQPELVDWMSTFDMAKQKALEDPASTDSFSSPSSRTLDPAFAISPPSAPEFTASAVDAGLHTPAEEGHDRSASLTLPGADTGLTQRGSFDVTPGRRATALEKEPESNREKLKQKLDLARRGTAQKDAGTAGIASLISASHMSLPVGPGVVTPVSAPDTQSARPAASASRTAYLARTLPPSSLAPSSLAAPPVSTNLSATAVMVNGERGIGIGRSDNTGGMPSGIMANLWGTTNWGYINQFERGEFKQNKDSQPGSQSLEQALPINSRAEKQQDGNARRAETVMSNTPGTDSTSIHTKSTSLPGSVPAPALQPAPIITTREYPNYYPVQLKYQDSQFRLLFPNAKKDEKLTLVFRATWNPNEQQEFPGRVYVTATNIYFYSNYLGLVLVSGYSLRSVSEFTAAPGRDCDFLFMHLKPRKERADPLRVTIKTFLDPLKLLQRRLNYLVRNCNSDEPEDLESIMKHMIKLEGEPEDRSPSQESWDDPFLHEEELGRQASVRSQNVRARILVDQGVAGLGKSAEKEGIRFKLPSKPVIYVPRGMSEPIVEKEFNISPKALFHVLFGDRSVVWQLLYHERRAATRIQQGPWVQKKESHMHRAFEYNVERTGLFGQVTQGLVTDTQIIDVLNDHLCYVVSDRKTPWHLPYHKQYVLSTKVVITHVAKSRSKLALFTAVEWNSQPFLAGALLKRHALSDLEQDALDLVDVVSEQTRKLGAQSQTKRSIQIFGPLGQQTQAVEFLEGDTGVASLLRRPMGRRTMPRLLLEASRSVFENVVTSILMWSIALVKWFWKTVNANSFVLLLLGLSVLTNFVFSSRETSGWWQERHASQYMRRLGIGKDLVMSKAIHISDLDQIIAVETGLGEDPGNACQEAFQTANLVDVSPPSHDPSIRRLQRGRQHIGEYRHDLIVAMRVVNSIEKEMVRAGWEDWVRTETNKCARMSHVLRKGSGVNATWAQDTKDVNEQFEKYCESCRMAEESALGNTIIG